MTSVVSIVKSSPVKWVRVATALAVAVVLATLSWCVMAAPRNIGMLQVVIGATEYSPFLALFDLVWCLAAIRMLGDHRTLRRLTLLVLVLSCARAVVPLTEFTQAAASASGQIGSEESQAHYSLITSIRGLPQSDKLTERTVPYLAADGSLLTMKIFSGAATAPQPVVVVIYGGGWRGGDASQCTDVSKALASRGFVVAAIDYRHAPASRFPAQIEDVRASLRLIRDSASSWKIDPARMAVLGRSSGGHLAELTAFSPGDVPVKAVIALYAPYDLVDGYRDVPSPDPIGVQSILVNFIGGTPDQMASAYHMASPASFIRAGLPPTLYIIAGRDHIVKPEFNRRAAGELRRAHVPVVTVEIPWAEHGFDMAPGGLGSQLAFNAIISFLQRELH